MECAVEGLSHMDEAMMNKTWDNMVNKYTHDPTLTNVVADKNTWTITYEEREEVDRVGVQETT